MKTRRLNENEFKATMTLKMQDITARATDALDIWPYVDSVPFPDGGALDLRWLRGICLP